MERGTTLAAWQPRAFTYTELTAIAERTEADLAVQLCADAVETLLSDGLEPAQNRFHALTS